MFTTLNMGLTAWDQGSDPYNHGQLASNFQAIDLHDHSPGKGLQVGTGGLKDNAITTVKITDLNITSSKIQDLHITTAKINNLAVTTAKLADLSVTTGKLADGAVTSTKLGAGIAPLGIIVAYDASLSVPTGWQVCDGTAWSAITNDLGRNTGNIVDLRNKFILGASPTGNNGSDPSGAPSPGIIAGSHTANRNHTHTVASHNHSFPDHSHSISSDGGHVHLWAGGLPTHQRTTGVGTASGSRQTLYVTTLNAGGVIDNDVAAPMDSAGSHNHSGVTGAVTGTITGNAAPATGNPSPDLAAVDQRPGFVGLLYIMRVRNV